MTFITISKTNGSYSATLSDRVATANNEQPKAHNKVISNYLTKLAAKEQLQDEEEVSRVN